MSFSGHTNSDRALGFVVKFSLVLLLLSAFRAPEDLPAMEPVVKLFKVFTRIGVLALLGFGLTVAWSRVRSSRTLPYFVPFLAFCGWGILSTAWSALKAESLGQAGSLTTLVLFSFAVSALVRDEEDRREFLTFLLKCLLGLCLFLLITGFAIPSTGHMTRLGLGLGHATNCGATASLLIVMLLTFALLWPSRSSCWLLFLGAPVGMAVLLISANRLSLAIAVVLTAATIVWNGGRYVVALAVLCVAIVGVFYPIVDADFSMVDRALEALNRDQSADEIGSLSGRSLMWEAMWESFLESPWIGHGYFVTSATGEMEIWYHEGEMPQVNWTAHNLWLQCLVTTGVIGLLFFLGAICIPWGLFLFRARGFPELRPLHGLIVILIPWYALWSILNESILGPVQPESVAFFAVLGVALGGLADRADSLLPDGRGPAWVPPRQFTHTRGDVAWS